MVSNVDKAFNYRPFEEERPNYKFRNSMFGGSPNNSRNKAVKATHLGQRNSVMSMTQMLDQSLLSESPQKDDIGRLSVQGKLNNFI